MVSIKWCASQKHGLTLFERNENMSTSYLRMAQESIHVLSNVQSSAIWTATTSYYVFYYSLYALMLRIGVKCEIHSCSLQFMREFLSAYYSTHDYSMIEKAMNARIDLQYYADRAVDASTIQEISSYCKVFFILTKDILSRITSDDIERIRSELSQALL